VVIDFPSWLANDAMVLMTVTLLGNVPLAVGNNGTRGEAEYVDRAKAAWAYSRQAGQSLGVSNAGASDLVPHAQE
jgi:hypothetical protein